MRMTRRAILGGLAAAAWARGARAGATRVSLADFGATPGASDASEAIARASAALRAAGGGQLLIPPGAYRVGAAGGVAFGLEGLKDLRIEGAGAKLMFEGLRSPIAITDCRNVTLRGLTLDWTRPPFSQGDVTALSPDGRVAEIALDAATPVEGFTSAEAIGRYDRATGWLSRKKLDAYGAVETIEPVSARVARLRLKWPIGLALGDTLVLRHSVYQTHAISLEDCARVTLEGVSVNAAPGMAFIGRRCRDVTMRGCAVEPTPGAGRLMSSCADAAHFVECSGEVVIENCRFANMGDDGLNVHGTYWRVIAHPDARSLLVAKRGDAPFEKAEIPATGTPFAIVSGETLEARGSIPILAATPLAASSPSRLMIQLARDAPSGTAAGDAVMDTTRDARLIVRNTKFLGNRARGVLAHKNVLIENCEFRGMSLQAILLGPDLFWLEGPEAANVRIVGNLFDDVDRWGDGRGAILADAIVAPAGEAARASRGFPNHGITLANNVFRDVSEPKVALSATRETRAK